MLTNPLKHSGHTLTIKASGHLLSPIEEGAYVKLEVKYGYIKLINQQIDLCENAGQIDLKCPVAAGDIIITKDVDLPKAIPPVSSLPPPSPPGSPCGLGGWS